MFLWTHVWMVDLDVTDQNILMACYRGFGRVDYFLPFGIGFMTVGMAI